MQGQRVRRADARANRDLLLAAAGELFAEQGLSAPLAEVARRAGVGVATLFRHFPGRDDLVAAVVAPVLAAYADTMASALEETDPWVAFTDAVTATCRLQTHGRGAAEALTTALHGAPEVEADRDRATAAFAELTRRAQATGRLRADFTHQDLVVVLMANAGIRASAGDAADRMSARLIGYLLQAFEARTDRAPLPPPASALQTYRALHRV